VEPMKIISINVGLPREVQWDGTTVETAIYKTPVNGPAKVAKLNIAGDRQADLSVHGGADKAVYGYASEHYEYWKKELPELEFPWGAFGENLTTAGLNEDNLHIGDRVKIGSAVLAVTQPRMPCYKLNIKFEREDMIKRFLKSGRCGFYFSVEKEGVIESGEEVEVLSRDAQQVSIADVVGLYLGQRRDPELLERALQVDALPQSWKAELALRASMRQGHHN
jgi:MOSC domain-containing protein YiiM